MNMAERNEAAWSVFLTEEDGAEVVLSHNGGAEIQKYLELVGQLASSSGDRFLLSTVEPADGLEQIITLTPENHQALLASLDYDNLETDDTWAGSDGKTQALLRSLLTTRGQFKITRLSNNVSFLRSASGRRVVRRITGSFYPFQHLYHGAEDYPFVEMLATRYQVFGSVEQAHEHYKVNCLVHALKLAGLPAVALVDLMHRCKRREVPRMELKQWCFDNDVCIYLWEPHRHEDGILRTEGGHLRKINAKGKVRVSLAVVHGHYILHEKVPGVHRFGLKNYETLKHKPRWWMFRNKRQRLSEAEAVDMRKGAGMWSFQVIDEILKTPISLETAGIFSTVYADSVPTYENLEYSASAVKPFRRSTPKQDYAAEITMDIETCTQQSGTVETNVADMKALIIKKHGEVGLNKILNTLDPDCSPEDVMYKLQMHCCHTPYLMAAKELRDRHVTTWHGGDVGEQFLRAMTIKYGGATELVAPKIEEVPASTIAPQIAALDATNVLAPLNVGEHSSVIELPANVYEKLGTLTPENIREIKQGDTEFKEKDLQEMMRLLRNFLQAPHEQVGDKVRVVETYKFSEHGFRGRVFSDGACGLFKALRSNILCDCADLDMSCCAQTIIAYLCGRNNVACPRTQQYVDDKRSVLAAIAAEENVSLKRAKELVQKAYFKDNVRKLEREHKSRTLLKMAREAACIRDALVVVPEHKWVLDSVAEQDNKKGKFLARLYQSLENKLLFASMQALSERGIEVQCLMFDGFAISAEWDGNSDVIQIVQDACEALLPTIGMKWCFKPLSFDVTDEDGVVVNRLDLRDAPAVETIKKVRTKYNRVCIIAHKGTYDWSCLIPVFNGALSFCERRTDIICGFGVYTMQHEGREISLRFDFKDSYKLIPKPLRDFASMFKLDGFDKEICPHVWYNVSNVAKRYASPKDIKPLLNRRDFETMTRKMGELGFIQPNGKWDMIAWSEHYCKQDVLVLEQGMKKFRELVMAFSGLDAMDFPTLASLADQHMTNKKCYEGVMCVSSIVQDFIAGANTGGRCMLGRNERSVTKNMTDFDVTSLYPAAMAFFDGFLMGSPNVIDPTKHDRAFLDRVDGYFVDYKVHSVARDLDIPVACVKGDNKCHWTNRLENRTIRVDKYTLEDLETYQGVTGTIVRGYYFDEGRNLTVKRVIREMFDLRAEYKDRTSPKYNKPMAEVVKLFMNTSYGVLSMKPIETKINYVSQKDYDRFVRREYNTIKQIDRISPHRYRVEQYVAVSSSFNRIHCSAEVLSFSKRMMNRVTTVAQDLNIRISYTDTDSLHFPAADLERLCQEYDRRYGSEDWFQPLCGKNLGQMHSDFEWVGCMRHGKDGLLEEIEEGEPAGGTEALVADKCVAVGKKIYMDRLVDKEGKHAYHVRLKGIPAAIFMLTCNEEYGGDIERLFDDLYIGETVAFDLAAGDKPCFKFLRSHQIASVRVVRKIRVDTEAEDMVVW